MHANPPTLRILILDDDRELCALMQATLEGDGHTLTTLNDASTLEDALHQHDYHLVVLDLMLPGDDGLDVLHRIRTLDADLAVVIHTGRPGLDSAIRALQLGATDYVRKPFELKRFRHVLDRVVRRKGLAIPPEERLQQILGETIRSLRKDKHLTLKQLSRRTGLSISLLSQIERAEASPSLASMAKIAQALDTRIQELFGPA